MAAFDIEFLRPLLRSIYGVSCREKGGGERKEGFMGHLNRNFHIGFWFQIRVWDAVTIVGASLGIGWVTPWSR